MTKKELIVEAIALGLGTQAELDRFTVKRLERIIAETHEPPLAPEEAPVEPEVEIDEHKVARLVSPAVEVKNTVAKRRAVSMEDLIAGGKIKSGAVE